MIVNDDHAATFALQKMLSDIGELLFLRSEDHPLDTVRHCKPDLILLDAEIAGALSFEICTAINTDHDHAGPPVIFIVTAGDTASEARALAAGAVDVIIKPFNSSIIRTRIRAHLALKQKNVELLQQLHKGESLQEELRAKHDMLANLALQVPGMLYQYRLFPDGRTTCPFVSESVRKKLGLSPEDLQKDASFWFEHIFPDDIAGLKESIEESARTLLPWKHEFLHVMPDKSLAWILGDSTPEKLDDGSILWHGYLRDVTEQRRAETALRQSEKRLLLAQQAARIGSFEWNIQANTRNWSPEIEALCGMAPGTFDGTRATMMKIIHPDDRATADKLIADALETGELDTEWRVVLPTGEMRWLAVRAQVFYDELGKPRQMVGINMDITRQKQTERDKNQLSEQRQRVLDAARLGWWHYDAETTLSIFDERFQEIFGFTETQLTITELANRLHPDDRPSLIAKIRAAQDPLDPKPYENEHRILLPDGSIRWVEARGMAAFEGEGPSRHAVSISGTVADITERKQLEKLHKITQFSIERAADPIFWITQDMRIHFVNETACRHLGYTQEEMLGLGIPDIDPTFTIDACNQIWSRLRQEKSILFEGLHRTKDGRLIPVEISANLLEYEGQEYNCALVRNITERKQAEQRIQRLTRLYAALSHCNQAIVRANNEQELFQEICKVSVEHGGMKMAWIGLIDQGTMQVRPAASCGMSPEYLEDMRVSIETALPLEQDLFGAVVRENRPVWCQEYVDSDFSAPAKERAIRYGWNGLAVLPLHRKGITAGTFALYAGDIDAFDEAAQNLLIEIASDIDFALDNFGRIAERKKAEEALRESEVRYSELFANNAVAMLLTDPESYRIVNANKQASTFYGWDIETLKTMRATDISPSPHEEIRADFRLAIQGRNRFFSQHRLANGELRDVELISGPVMIDGRRLLLASVHDITERNKARQELESSRERLAELSTQLIHAQEQEKKNLARELHDELGQRFTSLNITLHHMKEMMSTGESMQAWQKAAEDVATLTQRVRDISQSLRPSMLDYLGLGAAVEYLLKEHFSHSPIHYVFEYAGLPYKLPSQIEITAYRIVQEAITNVVRHSRATQVVIELNGGEDARELEIVIRDNGTGFDPDEARQRMSRSGIGLMGMRERVKLLGGEFSLRTELGNGTRISVMLPLK